MTHSKLAWRIEWNCLRDVQGKDRCMDMEGGAMEDDNVQQPFLAFAAGKR